MATFLDFTSLEYFNAIYVFVFVWVVVYATLLYIKVLGSHKLINALIGFILAIFVITSNAGVQLISKVAPFLTVIFVLIILFSIAGNMLGGNLEGFPAMKGIFITMILFVIFTGIALELREKYGDQGASTEPQSDLSKDRNLLLHPTFLGIVMLLSVAVFTIALLAKS